MPYHCLYVYVVCSRFLATVCLFEYLTLFGWIWVFLD